MESEVQTRPRLSDQAIPKAEGTASPGQALTLLPEDGRVIRYLSEESWRPGLLVPTSVDGR